MERFDLAVIIPAFNEENTIGEIVSSTIAFSHVIVVDDGSSDKTAVIAVEEGAILVKHENNKGHNESLRSGFSKAWEIGVQYMITMDADGQHQVKDVIRVAQDLKAGNELVLGIRPRKQRFSEILMGYYFYCKFGVLDILCGLKGYNIHLWKDYHTKFFDFDSIGTELACLALSSGRKFSQLNIELNDRRDKSRYGGPLTSEIRIIKTLILLLRRRMKN